MARDGRTKKDDAKKRKSTETKKKGMADPRAAIAVRLSSVFGRCAALPAESDPAVCESKTAISMDQYPEELLSLYERNNETETFVERIIPLKKKRRSRRLT